MGGEGHMLSMINSLKNNKAIRNDRKHLKDTYSPKGKTELEFIKKSDDELQEIRKKIKLKAKAERRKTFIILFVFSVIISIIFFILFWDFSINTDLFFNKYHRN